MNNSDPVHTAHILMVYPPSAAPSSPPWQMSRRIPPESVRGLPIEQYDANIDFFTRYLLKPETLKELMVAIGNKAARGIYKAADTDTLSVLKDLVENRSRWDSRAAAAGQYLKSCRGEDFYRPENGLDALENINALLKLASLAFYPSRIRWGVFANPDTSCQDRVMSFADNEQTNPFLAFYNTWLAPKLRQPGLCLLLLRVCSADQLPASATLAVFSKKLNPGLQVAVMGEPGLLAGCEIFADSLVSATDTNPLSEQVKSACGNNSDRTVFGTGFSRFEHGRYLAPAIVVPIDLTAGEGLQTGSLSRFSKTVKACRETLGAQGLLATIDSRRLERFTMATCPATDKAPDFSLGFCTGLRESCREIDCEALHRAGVMLIIWQRPEGALAVLKEVLWKTSRAGIWNHLKIPPGPNNALVKDLTHFAAANPNIVHSWSDGRISGFLSDCFDEQAPGLPVYSRVQELPGRPLWQRLNDPAHLLLYLGRHGLRKVMRWRVADDHPGVYTLGTHLEYHFKKPEALPDGYLDEICLMVEAGGSVDMARVRHNLQRAFLIAYVVENGVIVGNSSLKRPRPAYIKAVNRQSGLDLTHYVERGYTSVRPEYRGLGIGARLLEGLTEKAGNRKVFSIISEDNPGARKMALRNRTRQVAGYYSHRLGKRVGIWIPEWML